MSARKTLDIDAELQALQAKADKLRRDHLLRLGELVVETGVHKVLDADRLRTLLVDARDKALAADATAGDRPGKDGHGAAGSTFSAKSAAKANGHEHAKPEPISPRHPDLLARPEAG